MPISTAYSLSTLLWNANGLIQHRNELECFLHVKRIDLALITETHLTPQLRFNMTGYVVHRSDHPDGTAHGGSAILVRSGMSHHQLPDFDSDEIMQVTAVCIDLRCYSLNILAVYCPPRHRVTQQKFNNLFSKAGPRFLAGGDFNAKHPIWGSRLTNPRGRVLESVTRTLHLVTHSPGTPTYWPAARNRLPDALDIFISRGLDQTRINIDSLVQDLSSDHSPVVFVLNNAPVATTPPPSLTSGFIDWENFRTHLNATLDLDVPLRTVTDLDDAVERFTKSVQTAAWRSSSARPRKIIFRPTYPMEIRQLIRQKRRARHVWQYTRLPADKMEFNRLNNRLKKELQLLRNDRFDNYLSSLAGDDNESLWKATKRITKQPIMHSPILYENIWAKTDSDKAMALSKHLETTFQPHNEQDIEFGNNVRSRLEEPLQLSPPPILFSLNDIRQAVKQLPLKKSPGFDLITSKIVQELPEIALRYIQLLYNAVLRTSYFPQEWKVAIVVLFPKPAKPPQLVTSYRPISLLPLLGKMLERLLLPRLLRYCSDAAIIPQHQFGFRMQHSTIHQLHRLVDHIAKGFEERKYTTGVFLDVAAAFDRVWHDGLLVKVKPILPDSYFRLLRSFLCGRLFKVRQGNAYSELCEINAGVPQGAILSPLLYTIYTSDIPTRDDTLTATFADDTAILGQSRNREDASKRVQEQLNELSVWLRRWRVKMNANKSTQITFALRPGNCPPLVLNGVAVPQEQKVKYLGIWMDRRLTFKHHLTSKRNQLNARFRQLYPILCAQSKLRIEQKLLLYKSLLKPIWCYGLQIFGAAAATNLNRIQAFQAKILRIICGAPYYVRNRTLHDDLRIQTVAEVAKETYSRFHGKLHEHPNTLIRFLSTRQLPRIRRLRRRWNRDLLPGPGDD